MKIGRMLVGDEPRYVVQREDGWTLADELLPGTEIIGDAGDLFSRIDALSEAVRSGIPTGAPLASGTMLSPVVRPSKIICIGLNYSEHVGEVGFDMPTAPVVFAKWPNALTVPLGPVVLASAATGALDYEGELAVVIGTRCRDVPAAVALSVVGAYAVANDLSARDRQLSEGGQWTHSKSYDGFLPFGPWLTTADEIADPQALELTTTVNGEVRQASSTGAMIFPITELIAYLSTGLTLEPGDVILTGTPSGVAMALPGQPWLGPGDVVSVTISGLGEISNIIATEQ